MKRVVRYVEIDPGAEVEGKLLDALADVLDAVEPGEEAGALAAFKGIGVRVYSSRLMGSVERLREAVALQIQRGE